MKNKGHLNRGTFCCTAGVSPAAREMKARARRPRYDNSLAILYVAMILGSGWLSAHYAVSQTTRPVPAPIDALRHLIEMSYAREDVVNSLPISEEGKSAFQKEVLAWREIATNELAKWSNSSIFDEDRIDQICDRYVGLDGDALPGQKWVADRLVVNESAGSRRYVFRAMTADLNYEFAAYSAADKADAAVAFAEMKQELDHLWRDAAATLPANAAAVDSIKADIEAVGQRLGKVIDRKIKNGQLAAKVKASLQYAMDRAAGRIRMAT